MERNGPEPGARNTYRFTTDRLAIEVPEGGDVDTLYGLIGGDDRQAICATLLWDGPDDRSDTAEWVEKCRTEPFGEWGFHWVVRDRTGTIAGTAGQALGAIGTRPRGVPGRADVGYWLGRPYWGKGLMTEALAALVTLGTTELGYAKIEADVFAHNVAGRRLVERAGFEQEGMIRRGASKAGGWVDVALYGLVVDEP